MIELHLNYIKICIKFLNLDIPFKTLLFIDMNDIGKSYSPKNIEDKQYQNWLSSGDFDRVIDGSKAPFSILMPPPNVTGVLHMGHLLNQTLQDVFVRRARHQNKDTTWVVGTDHAGISMQVKVEKELAKDGIDWRRIGREKFLEHAKQWRDKHGGIILSQLKKLGVSCDFKHTVHTLDDDYSRAVLTVFVELYRRGYIYRGKRMVNWCPLSQTAISDEEVVMVSQKSKLYYIKYEIVERPGQFIEVSTTRPETIMGDVAIAVHPDDERFKSFIGLHCKCPLNRGPIVIISDSAVDPEFGTGALKITPAHDKVDFEVGQRHNLEFIDVLNPDGTLNKLAGDEFNGLDRFDARDKAAKVLEEAGALIKIGDYENNVGYSERGNVPIEPRVSEQWFLRYPKIEEAKRAVREGFIKLFPSRWEKTYLHWLDNIQDWCISRQLWWGHRIPVWYKKGCDRSDSKNWYVGVDAPDDIENWEQDDDVLDTWASSWLWPLAVFGWPDNKKMAELGMSYFYPTDVLVTGPDIIFFWVARMIMASLEFGGDEKPSLSDEDIKQRIPFKNVYFTGIIRDKLGRKMSKSLGNSPDPIDLIEKYGADSVRWGMLLCAPNGQDLIFNEDNLLLGRNFCTKLWNAFRFIRMHRSCEAYSCRDVKDIVNSISAKEMNIDDHSILLRLKELVGEVDDRMQCFDVAAVVNKISHFFWTEYCNWYLECTKSRMRNNDKTAIAVHDFVMRQLLLLLNPFIPFITDVLWHAGDNDDSKLRFQNVYCETRDDLDVLLSGLNLNTSSTDVVEQLRDLVNAARRLLSSVKKIDFVNAVLFYSQNEDTNRMVKQYSGSFKELTGVEIRCVDEICQLPSEQSSLGMLFLSSKQSEHVHDKQKLMSELQRLEGLIRLNQSKLENESFVSHAPAAVVDGARKLLSENQKKHSELKALLDTLE